MQALFAFLAGAFWLCCLHLNTSRVGKLRQLGHQWRQRNSSRFFRAGDLFSALVANLYEESAVPVPGSHARRFKGFLRNPSLSLGWVPCLVVPSLLDLDWPSMLACDVSQVDLSFLRVPSVCFGGGAKRKPTILGFPKQRHTEASVYASLGPALKRLISIWFPVKVGRFNQRGRILCLETAMVRS